METKASLVPWSGIDLLRLMTEKDKNILCPQSRKQELQFVTEVSSAAGDPKKQNVRGGGTVQAKRKSQQEGN